MRQICWLILLLVAVSGFPMPCGAGSHIDMLEGLWEIVAEVEMAGVPVRLPAITTRQCITPDNIFPEINRFNANDSNCKITNVVIGQNFAAYDLVCSWKNGEMRGHGSVTYQGERLRGSLTTVSSPDNEQMSYEYTGSYLGSCR